MKKKILIMFMALLGLSVSAHEKGDMAVGLNLGVAPCLESGASITNFGIGAKFQYNITDPIRVEADLDYWLKSSGVDLFDISANIHYLFKLSEKLTVYPLVGVGYAHTGGASFGGDFDYDFDYDFDGDGDGSSFTGNFDEEDFEGQSGSSSKILLNVGAGVDFAINDKLSVGAELKYQYIKYFSRLPISIGVTYKF